MKKSQPTIYKKKKQKKFIIHKHPKNAPILEEKKQVQVPIPPSSNKPKISLFKGFFAHKSTKEQQHTHWLKKHDSDIQLALFPSILTVILFILVIINNQVFHSIAYQEPIADEQLTSLNPYPYAQAANAPDISAQAAIVLDRGSQVILYSKNPQLRYSMASTTKIMTALIALNYYKPNDILTVKTPYVAGSGLNLYLGEQFHFMDLMYAMLLPSANDAAKAIADNYPGGADAFVAQMNAKAQSLHLSNTHYGDPIGLDDDGDYSTVVDMAHLASYAETNPTFVQITSTKAYTISDLNFTRTYPLTNLNRLLGIDGVNGIKTGTTEGAGEVLATSVEKNDHDFIIIVMDSVDRFADTEKLLNFIDTDVKYIVPPVPQK